MDIEVRPIGNDIWHLADLLGRPAGSIVQTSRGFRIEHDGKGLLDGVGAGPFATLTDAMEKVAEVTRGACRLA